MGKVIIVVNIKVKKEFTEEVYVFMKALHKLTHEFDGGCIQYDLHRVSEESNCYCFIETWENQEALDTHMQKDHFKNFMDYVEDKIEDMQIMNLDKYEEENN